MKNINEANRCLLCNNPRCKSLCPISTDIPRIMELYMDGELEEAGRVLFENNPLSLVCAVVCPHENQCMGGCVMGIHGESIDFPAIEWEISSKFLKEHHFEKVARKGKRIAIIGSGPAGISMAFFLALKGYGVTIFEKESRIGGVLRYGIPEFRLQNQLIDNIEDRLIELGVKIRYNELIGPVNNVEKMLADGYGAVFIGTGVGNPKTLGVKGETLGHVHYAVNYLKSPESFRLGNKVAVIGAGNVAMDAARTAKRHGADKVHVVYRRGREAMKATEAEIEETLEDGVIFTLNRSPLEIVDEGLMVNKTKNEVDSEGNKKLVTIPDSKELFECDSVIIAISQGPQNNIVANTKEHIKVDRYGLVIIDDKGHTTTKGVFASGDVVTGAKTVVEAIERTKQVAKSIIEYIED